MTLEFKKNSKGNVGSAKGKTGGYAFFAPRGTVVPTTLDEELAAGYFNLGYVSDDGITSTPSYDSEEHKDINGDVVDSGSSGYGLKVTATLIETKRDVARVKYGDGNATDEAGVLTVHNKGTVGMRGPLVLELVLKGMRRMRRVYPDAEMTELGEEKVVSSDLFGQEATFTAYKDDVTGDYCTDYIESTETTKE